MTSTVPGPPAPAPFRRSVDELSEDEVLAAIEEAQGAPPAHTSDERAVAIARDLYDAIAVRLRVDGPTPGCGR